MEIYLILNYTVDLTSNFFFLVYYMYQHGNFQSGWSLAWIFTKERVNTTFITNIFAKNFFDTDLFPVIFFENVNLKEKSTDAKLLSCQYFLSWKCCLPITPAAYIQINSRISFIIIRLVFEGLIYRYIWTSKVQDFEILTHEMKLIISSIYEGLDGV